MFSKKRKVDTECRKFNESWTSKFFVKEHGNKVLCVICNYVVAVMKEYNIKRHYETKHSHFDKYNGDERIAKAKELFSKVTAQQQLLIQGSGVRQRNVTEASYEVSKLIAENGKPFSDGEFVKKCLVAVAKKLCPDKIDLFNSVSLSRNTVSRRVEELASSVRHKLVEKGKQFEYFSIACDESTDITDCVQLLVFVRGIDTDFQITEELIGVRSVHGTTKGTDLFEEVVKAIDNIQLDWAKLCSITTDGAPCMLGVNTGMAELIKKKVEVLGGTVHKLHCIVHQEVLCAKAANLDGIVQTVTKIINFIRSRALNHRTFKTFLDSMNSEYGDVIYHAEIRWLSRGQTLARFFALRNEIRQFLEEKKYECDMLSDHDWLSSLAFLVDMTKHLNDLNIILQGKDKLINEAYSAITAFKLKLKLLKRHVSMKNWVHFPSVNALKNEFPELCFKSDSFVEVIERIEEEFANRFVDFNKMESDISLFSSPFSFDVDKAPAMLQFELIDLQCDDAMKGVFDPTDLIKFYKLLPEKKYLALKEHARRLTCMFSSTYLCEQTFSKMKIKKSRLRSSLSDEHLQDVLFISTTQQTPDIDSLLSSKSQFHSSH